MTDEERDTLDHLREQRDGLEKQVASLRAELAAERERQSTAPLWDEIHKKNAMLDAALARNTKLREALEPFAEVILFDSYKSLTMSVEVEHLRRARAVLKEVGGGDA
jgi:hypothetical protein